MKTVECVAKEFSEKSVWACPISFKAGVEFAQRWISVEDELPEEDKVNDFSVCILVKDMHGKAMSAYYDFKKCGFYSNALSKSELIGITHWRPIELK